MQSLYADTVRWRRMAHDAIKHSDAYTEARSDTQTSVCAPGRVAIEPRLSVSEMCATVARAAIHQSSFPKERAIGQIVVCATSFEHDLALSCAGRLHSEFGSARAPFAIGQLQGVAFLLALQVARDLMNVDAELQTVLIVAAERWLAPFPRIAATGERQTALGDGAAATLIHRGTGPGWYVRGVTVDTSAAMPRASSDDGIDESAIARMVTKTCTQAGLAPADIDWIVPARLGLPLARAVSARAAVPSERLWYPAPSDATYLCAADAPAQLDTLLRTIAPHDGQHILIWSAGFQGQVGCAIFTFCERSPCQ